MPSNPKTIVLLASDLMLSSTISGHVAATGSQFRSTGTVIDAVNVVNEHRDALLLVDLGLPGLNVEALAGQLSADTLHAAVAYGPHVHVLKLDAAKAAGFGSVMSRGSFSASVGQLITKFVTKSQEQGHG